MGHMDVISIISNGFNVYFPMVMIIISMATYFNVGSHLLSAIGFPQYFADDEITEDIVTEGQRLALAGELWSCYKRFSTVQLELIVSVDFSEKDKRLRKGLMSPGELPESNYRSEEASRSRRYRRGECRSSKWKKDLDLCFEIYFSFFRANSRWWKLN